MLDVDTVRTCVFEFELADVEDDDDDDDADANGDADTGTEVDSGTGPASTTTSDDARVNDGSSGGSDGSPEPNSERDSRARVPLVLRLASISAARGPGSHTRGGP